MNIIEQIEAKYKINEKFIFKKTPGLANNIYMSESYVLRIPSDHPESIPDILTESVAVPNVLRYGIKTRKLIIFDDSYTIINKPFSIWEKVNGIPLSEEIAHQFPNTWFELGKELKTLHTKVLDCDDPKRYLDSPDREYNVDDLIGWIRSQDANSNLIHIINEKYDEETFCYSKCFVHGDTNPGNVISSEQDTLLSLIDWGDSGWGDPAIDFYMIPANVLKYVIRGYLDIKGNEIDQHFYKRILFDKIALLIDEGLSVVEIERIISKLFLEIEMFSDYKLTTAST